MGHKFKVLVKIGASSSLSSWQWTYGNVRNNYCFFYQTKMSVFVFFGAKIEFSFLAMVWEMRKPVLKESNQQSEVMFNKFNQLKLKMRTLNLNWSPNQLSWLRLGNVRDNRERYQITRGQWVTLWRSPHIYLCFISKSAPRLWSVFVRSVDKLFISR